jgi:hypothetical protein
MALRPAGKATPLPLPVVMAALIASSEVNPLSRPKMKIQVISRSKQDYVRTSDKDLHKLQRNADPKLHPFEKAREYTRALNAVKLDKVYI